MISVKTPHRCRWAGEDPLYIQYHDTEWGVPLHNDRMLFEFLTLEGAQAGLSWITILRKREAYRSAFDQFDPEKIAGYTDKKITSLLNDTGIVRNRLKIQSVVKNARALLAIQNDMGSFDHYIWQFVNHQPIQNAFADEERVPASTPESEKMSRDMKKRGFSFVGPTICYALMQAVGMVNDHVVGCFRHAEISSL